MIEVGDIVEVTYSGLYFYLLDDPHFCGNEKYKHLPPNYKFKVIDISKTCLTLAPLSTCLSIPRYLVASGCSPSKVKQAWF